MRRRDFSGPDDLRAMQAMCSRLWSPAARFHPGQLAWNRYHQPVDPALPGPGEAISLWRRGDEVVAFGWAEAPDWLEYQLDPAYPEVGQDLLEWFEDWSDAGTQSVLAMHDDVLESDLAAAGFMPERAGPYFVHHLLDLARLSAMPAVDGYSLRHLEPGEAGARATCHAASWSGLGRSRMTATAYAALMRAWPYRHDLDWVAIDSAGGIVASALVWFDPATGVGLLEPVGCVPAHRGHGLAAAVSLAALHHLRGLGADVALVTARGDDAYPGPRRLYQRLGFRPGARTVTWTRSLL
ncbi:MAG: GNAT family N-acetyltransferase [Micrococcales bacterium]|nr:GNAT family N-acetyltransferase [Micrococcales bacterium]